MSKAYPKLRQCPKCGAILRKERSVAIDYYLWRCPGYKNHIKCKYFEGEKIGA